jgi:hypothetical protein
LNDWIFPNKGTLGAGGVKTLMNPVWGLIFKICERMPVAAYKFPSLPGWIAQAKAIRPVNGRLEL